MSEQEANGNGKSNGDLELEEIYEAIPSTAPQKPVFIEDLKPRHQVFVNAYLKCWNASEAARQAKYPFAGVAGSGLLENPKIRSCIEQELRRHHLTSAMVLHRLRDMATSDITDFVDDSGNPKLESVREQGKGYLIKKIKTKRYKTGDDSEIIEQELELYDAQSALVHVGKHLGLFNDANGFGSTGPAVFIQLNVSPNEIVGKVSQNGSEHTEA
jgi:phage terminase small subunit